MSKNIEVDVCFYVMVKPNEKEEVLIKLSSFEYAAVCSAEDPVEKLKQGIEFEGDLNIVDVKQCTFYTKRVENSPLYK